MQPNDEVELSPAMAEVLELESPASAGNVMAHAIRAGYASSSSPFEGIGFGWADEDPEALAFVVGLVESADESGLPIDSDDAHEIADAAVPIYSAAVWAAAGRLRTLFDDDEINGLGGGDDTEQRLKIGLYVVATTILAGLS
jgi:hypothetical protein